MNITEAMLEYDLRLTLSPRWLVHDATGFMVYEQKRNQRGAKIVCQTDDEAIAVKALINEEAIEVELAI
jgi:hypothetical protein